MSPLSLRGWLLAALPFVAAGVLLLCVTPQAGATDKPTKTQVVAIIREAASAYGLSGDYLVAVADCESTLDVWAVGAAGELGLFQLHPRGLLPTFRAWGYSDPWDASEQAWFAARAFSLGYGSHWSCA